LARQHRAGALDPPPSLFPLVVRTLDQRRCLMDEPPEALDVPSADPEPADPSDYPPPPPEPPPDTMQPPAEPGREV
jgi:hypothetical protein